MIPKVLTNKTVLTGIQNTFLKDSLIFKPAFGDAANMGKVLGGAPALARNKIEGTFKADVNAMLKMTPTGLSSPKLVLKHVVR